MNENITLIDAIGRAMQGIGFGRSIDLPKLDYAEVTEYKEGEEKILVKSAINGTEYEIELTLNEEKDTIIQVPGVSSFIFVLQFGSSFVPIFYEKIEHLKIGEGSNKMGLIKIKEQQDEINSKLTNKINEIISFLNNLTTDYKAHTHPTPTGASSAPTVPFPGNPPSNAQEISQDNYKLEKIIQIKYE